ncbi:MAG: hypothetical protein ACLTCV_04980 [Oscillospiraceae bacterium]
MGGRVYVVGCDNSRRQIQFLEQNIIQATAAAWPVQHGLRGDQQAVRVANGEQTDDFLGEVSSPHHAGVMRTQGKTKAPVPCLR